MPLAPDRFWNQILWMSKRKASKNRNYLRPSRKETPDVHLAAGILGIYSHAAAAGAIRRRPAIPIHLSDRSDEWPGLSEFFKRCADLSLSAKPKMWWRFCVKGQIVSAALSLTGTRPSACRAKVGQVRCVHRMNAATNGAKKRSVV